MAWIQSASQGTKFTGWLNMNEKTVEGAYEECAWVYGRPTPVTLMLQSRTLLGIL